MNIKILKMTSGEFVLTEIVSETQFTYKVKSPCTIVPIQDNQGRAGLGLQDWCPFSEERIELIFQKAHVICEMKPIQAFIANYQARVSSIVTPPSLIMPAK